MTSSDLERKTAFYRDVEALFKHDTNNDDETTGVLPAMKTVFFNNAVPSELNCTPLETQTSSLSIHSSENSLPHDQRLIFNAVVPSSSPALEPIDDNPRKIRSCDISFYYNSYEINKNTLASEKNQLLRKPKLDITSIINMPLQRTCSESKNSKQPCATGRVRKTAPRSNGAVIPAHKRIFQGLNLYFIPPDKKNPARRIRIDKAVSYGAKWIQEWTDDVHYIVTEDGLRHEDVLRFLKLSQLPSDVVAVNAKWTPDCISNGSLVDPCLATYRLEGSLPIQQTSTTNPQHESRTSLPLKRAIEADILFRQHTPTQVEESFHETTHRKETTAPYVSASPAVDPQDKTLNPNDNAAEEDPLSEIFIQVKATVHLPLDCDDEERESQELENLDEQSFESSSDRDKSKSPQPKRKKKFADTDSTTWQSKFQCMRSHELGESERNPNEGTINILQQMLDYYNSIHDQWRSRAYRQCISALRRQKKQIRSKEEAESIPFIGESLAAKIEEISRTNKLRQLENRKLEPADKALKLFLGIYGVGFTQAAKWAQNGHRSLQDLVEANVGLTSNQIVGIEHYTDFNMRIPRKEVEQLGGIVQRALIQIDPMLQGTVGGSYRRGSPDSGDIDMLITKPSSTLADLRVLVLETVVPRLQKQGFLVAALAVTNRDSGSKWHGACQLPQQINKDGSSIVNDPKTNCNPWRRIDLLLVPSNEIGAALLYFTGNDIFNRSMRLLARRKGMRLNQKGLYDDVLRRGSDRLTDGVKIAGESERDIFDKLGVPWREAWERNV